MKKLISVLIAASLCAALSGCTSSAGDLVDRLTSGEKGSVASSEQSTSYDGKIGEKMSTYFFDFKVDSADIVADYDGFTASEGNALLDAVVTVTNTFDDELPMYSSDFQLQWGAGDDEFGYAAEDTLTMPDCMPDEYTLDAGESGTYHMVFEVPAGKTDFSIAYLEEFDDDTTGDSYFVEFTVGAPA